MRYEQYVEPGGKKYCEMCGCIMDADHESDICECCWDDVNEALKQYETWEGEGMC